MAFGKWIGGFLGFAYGGPLGAILGFVFGSIFDAGLKSGNIRIETNNYNNREYDDYDNQRYQRQTNQQATEGQRNSFLLSLLVLAAYVMKADGKVMHSEMEVVRNFLRQNFGSSAQNQGEEILQKIFDYQKQVGSTQFKMQIQQACQQIAQNMDYSSRLQLISFLVAIAQADGNVATEEINAIREVAANLGISAADVNSMLNLRDSGNDLDAAYKVLGITKDATDDEVKAAYRKMALKHHPDKVATLGDDVKKAAEQKFKEINDAKDKIYKARGMK